MGFLWREFKFMCDESADMFFVYPQFTLNDAPKVIIINWTVTYKWN